MVGQRIGRFRVLEKIGEGGMATVWKAHDELLDRIVALKVLAGSLTDTPDARRRFRHEAEVASRLDHSAIAPVYASGVDGDVAYLTMAFIDGETLSERLACRLPPIHETVEIVRVAATALGYAHGLGIVHRDVTSRNIMVARDGTTFVLDFGLAIAAGISRITSHDAVVGTIAYMAPEVLSGCPADPRCDLYGLGVVLYEALTGALPFWADGPEVLKYAALYQDPRRPRERRAEISPELERVVLRAIARDADVRYQTAGELLDDLNAIETAPAAEAAIDRSVAFGARTLIEGGPTYLAVLPFEPPGDETGDPDGMGKRFCEDMTSALAVSLARAGRIHVVPLGGQLPNDASAAALRSFARRVGAQVVLRGSVRRHGSQLRVTHALIDPESGGQIGGGSMSGSTSETFDFEDRVIAQVQDSLRVPAASASSATKRPRDPAAPDRYRQALGNLKRYDNEASVDGAIQLLERLIAGEADVAKYHAVLARACLRKLEHTEEHLWEGRAAAACERALQLDRGHPEVLLAFGDLRRSTGRHDEAVKAYESSIRGGGDDFEARLGIALARVNQGRSAEAENACAAAVAARPDDWRGHSVLGWIYFQRGDFAAALEPWTQVVRLAPDNAKGRRNLGSAYHRLDRFDDAILNYERSLAIQPNHVAYGNLGTALYFTGRYEEAVAALRRATELTPSDPIRWGSLAGTCRNLARLGHTAYEQESEDALDRAIGLIRERLTRNPNAAEWWAFLAGYLADRDMREEAEDAIRKALTLAPADAFCMARAGYICHHFGDRSQAVRWFRNAVAHGYGRGEFARSPELAPLRDDPEFVRLLEEDPPRSAEHPEHA